MQLKERIGRRLKLQDLNVFMAVVQAGSMGKAAQRLNTAQPVISRSIAQLEHALGVRLLDRSRQGVEPTAYGRELVRCGTAVFDELRQGVRSIEFLADPTEGELLIGCDSPRNSGVLPAIIARFRREYPRVDIHVSLIPPVQEQYRALRERKLDLVFGRIAHPVEEAFDAEVLFEEHIHVVAGAHNRLCRRRKLKLSDLSREPWTLPVPDSVVGSHVANAFRAGGLEFPPSAVVTGTADMHTTLVTGGPFLAIYPSSLLWFGPKGLPLKVLPVELPLPPAPVGVVTLKGRTLSPVAQLFIKCSRQVVKPLAKARKTGHRVARPIG